MPEAAVDEHAEAFGGKREIGMAWEIEVPPPTAHPGGSQQRNKPYLSARITAASNQ